MLERAAAVQAAIAQSSEEVAHLKDTVTEMRYALVAARHDGLEARAAAERAFRDEREQLHNIIAALRARLEASDVA
jgi:hypothetical protein